MKCCVLTLSFVLILIFFSCNSSKKSDQVASYSYEEDKIEMNATLKTKTPEWVEEGKVCYGLVIQISKTKTPIKGKPVKAKVVQIGTNAIKMKALETVSLAEVEGCTKMGISKGKIWDEKEGDFFLTRAEAIKELKAMKIYKNSDKVTVD